MTPEAAANVAAASAAGIHTIVLPVPFGQVGVTCYLIEDDPLTLVDVGVNWGTSMLVLERSLATRGRRIEDLERLVLTHQHPDHAGGVEVVVERSGAEVVAAGAMARWLADQVNQQERDDAYRSDMLGRHGLPAAVGAVLGTTNRVSNAWGCIAEVTHPVSDGDDVVFGQRTWKVLARPGHSSFDTVFVDEDREIAIVGDHLIPDFPSVPWIDPPADPALPDVVPGQLPAYCVSLDATRPLPLGVLLPGHGLAFTGHRTLIDRRREEMRKLMSKIETRLADGPASAYAISTALWTRAAIRRPEATMATILGHLALLHDKGAVRACVEENGVLFELS